MSLHKEISTFLDAYFEAWNRYDVPAMKALWDNAEEMPIYLAEECGPTSVGRRSLAIGALIAAPPSGWSAGTA